MTAKYGTPYFSNYINSDMEPSDVRSMCCRLRLDLRELRKKSGGFFGSGESTGSIGVVTINLPRIAYLAEDEKDFYVRLAIRELHLAALRDYDFSCADEMLYPENYRYLSDLLSYVAIGARSVENQQHRLVASGIGAPVGMKNPTGGDLGVMMNSIVAAQSSHTFIYRGWEVTSEGNPYSHAILRGYIDFAGRNVSNYHYEDLLRVEELYEKSNLTNPSVIVDTNHNNSGKKYLEQVRIAKDIVHSRNQNADIKRLVKGLMIESYLEDGACKTEEHIFGKSITDPCLGWEKTEKLILDLADKL